MRQTRTLLLTLSALTLALAACGAGTGADDPDTTTPDTTSPETTDPDAPLGAGPYPVADLEVVVEHPDRETITYRITCLGDTATITGDVDLDERAACLALARDDVQQRLIDGPQDEVCTEQHGGPDTAAITGTIDDVSVTTMVDRTNGCGISDWDVLLADILPEPLGVTE